MARITLRQLLDHAAEHDYGVPAFNINNMEQALAIGEAASAVDAPVIIQVSRGARAYANDVMMRHMMTMFQQEREEPAGPPSRFHTSGHSSPQDSARVPRSDRSLHSR